MLKCFYPDLYVDSVYELDFESFYTKGYKALIFDIDNTLVPHGAPATEEAISFFHKLNNIGFKTLVISNNKEKRVKSFADAVGCKYIYKANKPFKKGYLNGMSLLEVSKEETIFVGDQLFTDVWGAKNIGIYSILTKPINPKEEIQIVLKRYLEKPILKSYQKYIDKQRK